MAASFTRTALDGSGWTLSALACALSDMLGQHLDAVSRQICTATLLLP